MDPGRIAIVVTKMDEGGTINVALQLAAGLRGRGHHIETFFLYVARSTLLGQPGIRAMLPGTPAGALDYVRMATRLRSALRTFRPDAVHGIMPLANIVGLSVAQSVGCRSRVASQHQPWPSLNPVMRALDRVTGASGVYTANIAVSESVRASFAGHPGPYRERMVVIPNGVADRASTLPPDEARRSFGLPQGAPLIGTIGRLTPEKNHAFLLEVLARVPDVHLAVGGVGELEGMLREKAALAGVSDRVHLLGQVAFERVPDLLRAFDVFVFPSVFEGMPIALLEAMMAGLPIVASDIAANREVATGCTALVDTGSAEAWAAELGRLLASADARAARGAAARTRAESYTNDAMIDAYERLLLTPPGPSQANAGAREGHRR